MSTIDKKLFKQVSDIGELKYSNKISIVGVGQVGMACAFSLLTQNVCSEICLVDVVEDKLKGEMLDLQHGSMFLRNAKIKASKDYAITANSKICVVTAGVRQNPDESRLSLVQRNANLLKLIIPQLIKYSPETTLLIVSNPVDILTQLSWKLSGLPVSRVIGSGTNLDSSRFRFLLSEKVGVAPSHCHGWIIGEHGDSSVAVWSSVNVTGVNLANIDEGFNADTRHEDWNEMHKEVIDSAYKIIKLKGYTSWAIGLSVSSICNSILRSTNNVHAVSTLVEGVHGITKPVFLSLPCVLNEDGVSKIIKQPLTEAECNQLRQSADKMNEVLQGIVL